MSHILLFLSMPFLGIRLGMPMITGGGDTTPPPPPTYSPTYFILGF